MRPAMRNAIALQPAVVRLLCRNALMGSRKLMNVLAFVPHRGSLRRGKAPAHAAPPPQGAGSQLSGGLDALRLELVQVMPISA